MSQCSAQERQRQPLRNVVLPRTSQLSPLKIKKRKRKKKMSNSSCIFLLHEAERQKNGNLHFKKCFFEGIKY